MFILFSFFRSRHNKTPVPVLTNIWLQGNGIQLTVPRKHPSLVTPSMHARMVASELNYVIDNYGYHENYLRVNKKPVILIFNADGQGRDRGFWANVRSRIWDCVLAGDFRNPALLDVFDGVHIYNELPPRHSGSLHTGYQNKKDIPIQLHLGVQEIEPRRLHDL